MRRRYSCLLACAVSACVACGSGASTPTSPAGSGSVPTSSSGSPRATAHPSTSVAPGTSPDASPLPSASPTGSPDPTPVAGQAWTARPVALADRASDEARPEVHLGSNFPITLTAKSATVDGDVWFEVTWKTPSRDGTGWLPASAVTTDRPENGATAGIDALDANLQTYLRALGTHAGVEVLDVSRGGTYTYNADLSFYVASSVKVPIMLTFLSQLEARHAEPSANDRWLLTTMIENSRNESATALYQAIGYQSGIAAFMKSVGISGLVPASNEVGEGHSWGYSIIKPATMVALLAMLHDGTVLNAAHRAFALNLMAHIDGAGQVGVGDSSPAGATVAFKDGWVKVDDPAGPWVVNSSGIVTLGAETYIISVYTDHDSTAAVGYQIVRHVCKVVGQRLMASS